MYSVDEVQHANEDTPQESLKTVVLPASSFDVLLTQTPKQAVPCIRFRSFHPYVYRSWQSRTPSPLSIGPPEGFWEKGGT